MSQLKYYDGSSWVNAVVGAQGPAGATGIVSSGTAPSDTSILWADTSATGNNAIIPAGGTTGQALVKTSSTDYATQWSTVASGGGTMNETEFLSSSTFTVPTGVTKVWVEVLAGGGGGAGSNDYGAAGGGAGARVFKQVTVTPADSITVTIGSGGAGGGSNTGGSGGNASSFGSLSASGGSGAPRGGGTVNTWTSIGQSAYGVAGETSNTGSGGNSQAGGGGAGGSGRVMVRWIS